MMLAYRLAMPFWAQPGDFVLFRDAGGAARMGAEIA